MKINYISIKDSCKLKNIIYYNLSFINGNIFYAFEYAWYLKDNWKLVINTTPEFLKKIIKLWKEKYQKKFLDLEIYVSKRVIIDNILILDSQSFKDFEKKV